MKREGKSLTNRVVPVVLGIVMVVTGLGYVPVPLWKRDGNWKDLHLGALNIKTEYHAKKIQWDVLQKISAEYKPRPWYVPPIFQPIVDGVRIDWQEARSKKPEYTYRRLRYSGYRFDNLTDTRDDGVTNITIRYDDVKPEFMRELAKRPPGQSIDAFLVGKGCSRVVFRDSSWFG